MLRVITEQHGDRYILSLHGRLGGPWVAELERYWRSIVSAVPSAAVLLDLAEVSFIEPAGETLLQRMMSRGTEVTTHGCMTRSVVDRIRQLARAGGASQPATPARLEPAEVAPNGHGAPGAGLTEKRKDR